MDYFMTNVVCVGWKLLSSCCFDGHYVKDCFVQYLLSIL